MKLALALALLATAACSDPPNFQRLPIGSRCGQATDCGSSPFTCDVVQPNGYCVRSCTTDGDCPKDSVCVGASVCRRRCTDASQCRASEGYVCAAAGATSNVCEAPGPGGDGGA